MRTFTAIHEGQTFTTTTGFALSEMFMVVEPTPVARLIEKAEKSVQMLTAQLENRLAILGAENYADTEADQRHIRSAERKLAKLRKHALTSPTLWEKASTHSTYQLATASLKKARRGAVIIKLELEE